MRGTCQLGSCAATPPARVCSVGRHVACNCHPAFGACCVRGTVSLEPWARRPASMHSLLCPGTAAQRQGQRASPHRPRRGARRRQRRSSWLPGAPEARGAKGVTLMMPKNPSHPGERQWADAVDGPSPGVLGRTVLAGVRPVRPGLRAVIRPGGVRLPPGTPCHSLARPRKRGALQTMMPRSSRTHLLSAGLGTACAKVMLPVPR